MSFIPNAYVDGVTVLGDILHAVPCSRTGLPLASSRGPFTFFLGRLPYEEELLASMPAINIDLNPFLHVDYLTNDQTTSRYLPVRIILFVPLFSGDEDATAAAAAAESLAADQDIKTALGDLESVLTSEAARYASGKRVALLPSPGVEYDEAGFEAATHVKARIAELWLHVIGPIT